VDKVERALSGIKSSPKVAIMGCVVNGPGEAKEADVGIAGGRGHGVLFKHGQLVGKVPERDLAQILIEEVKKIAK
jgi:(E)-4-hydroxy-3-methylbut-2-enyl-diphosphate synthase